MHFLLSADLFQKLSFSKKSLENTIRESNSLDSNLVRHHVGPDLSPNCLERLSADNKSLLARKEFENGNNPVFIMKFLTKCII